jgi:hypothetical protein
MHIEKTVALTNMPALVLALVLLSAVAAGSFKVAQYVLMAPGTLLPAAAPRPPARPQQISTEQTSTQQSEAFSEIASGPGWETLSTAQKLALYPLAERWAVLSESQKRRWLALAQTFTTLPTDEQEKLHNRMTEWANLSSLQRSQARLNYADAQRLAPSDKLAQWEAYQALSEEERNLLAADAPAKPAGAATALRPVAPQKLAKVPAATQAGPARANPPKIEPLDQRPPRAAVPPPAVSPPSEVASSPAAAPVSVETNPIATPSATPSSLPPLPASAPQEAPVPRPEDLGYQPQ